MISVLLTPVAATSVRVLHGASEVGERYRIASDEAFVGPAASAMLSADIATQWADASDDWAARAGSGISRKVSAQGARSADSHHGQVRQIDLELPALAERFDQR